MSFKNLYYTFRKELKIIGLDKINEVNIDQTQFQ